MIFPSGETKWVQTITIWPILGLGITGFHIGETEAVFRNQSVGLLYKYILMHISFFSMASKSVCYWPISEEGFDAGGVNVGWLWVPTAVLFTKTMCNY